MNNNYTIKLTRIQRKFSDIPFTEKIDFIILLYHIFTFIATQNMIKIHKKRYNIVHNALNIY